MLRDSVKRCMQTFSKSISEDDPLTFCFEWLWYEHAALALKEECKYCDVLPIKLLYVQHGFIKEEWAVTPSLRSWNLCINLAEVREVGPSLSLVLSPDWDVLAGHFRCAWWYFFGSARRHLISCFCKDGDRECHLEDTLTRIKHLRTYSMWWLGQWPDPQAFKLDDRFLSGGQ